MAWNNYFMASDIQVPKYSQEKEKILERHWYGLVGIYVPSEKNCVG